jgi:hypothetical protein
VAYGFRGDAMCTWSLCDSSLVSSLSKGAAIDVDVQRRDIRNTIFYESEWVRCFTYFDNCTYVPEFTITSSWRLRYSSLDQVYSTCKFVVSLQSLQQRM